MGKLGRAWGAVRKGYHWLWVLEASTRYCAMLVVMWTLITAGAVLGIGSVLAKGIMAGDPRTGSLIWLASVVAFDLFNLVFWVKKYKMERERKRQRARRQRELMEFIAIVMHGWRN